MEFGILLLEFEQFSVALCVSSAALCGPTINPVIKKNSLV
jgi:hypothetical protein